MCDIKRKKTVQIRNHASDQLTHKILNLWVASNPSKKNDPWLLFLRELLNIELPIQLMLLLEWAHLGDAHVGIADRIPCVLHVTDGNFQSCGQYPIVYTTSFDDSLNWNMDDFSPSAIMAGIIGGIARMQSEKRRLITDTNREIQELDEVFRSLHT